MGGLDVVDDAFVDVGDSRPDQRMRRFLGRFTLVVLAVVIAASTFVWRYQPLRAGDVFGARIDPAAQEGSATAGAAPSRLAYSPGGTVDVIFSLDNAGLVPVHIRALPDALQAVSFSYEVRQMPSGATGYDDAVAAPFRPFNLKPGEGRTLDLRYTLRDCGQTAAGVNRVIRRQPVRYDVGPLRRSVDVRLVEPVVISGMPACPAG